MPLKARCSKSSPSYGIKDDRTSCSSCLMVPVLTSPSPGPTLSRRPRVPSSRARMSLVHRTCYVCASVLTVCCAGLKPIRPQTKTRQPRRANMQRPQMELWSAEPHPTPPIYQQLTRQQRSQLVSHLAELILKLVQNPLNPPPIPTPTKDHER
jgi:hypothetical protein